MTLESIIVSINRILRNTAKVFGLNTQEYHDMKYLVKSFNEHMDLFTTSTPGEPIRILRSKTAMGALKDFSHLEVKDGKETLVYDIEDTLKAMRRSGSVLQKAKKYDPTMTEKRLSSPIEKKRIRKLAVQESAKNYMIPDWYKAIDDIEDLKLQAQARSKFRDGRGLKGQAYEDNYEKACEYVRQCLLDEGKMLKELNMSGSKNIGTPTNLAGALSYQK